LEKYLRFLELVVLNERLIVGHYDFSRELSPEVANKWFRKYIFWDAHTLLKLEETTFRTLTKEEIIFDGDIVLKGTSPVDYVKRYLKGSASLKKRFALEQKLASQRKVNPEEAAYQQLAAEFGLPLYLGDFALRANIPYFISQDEIQEILGRVTWDICMSSITIGALRSLPERHLPSGTGNFGSTNAICSNALSCISMIAGSSALLAILIAN